MVGIAGGKPTVWLSELRTPSIRQRLVRGAAHLHDDVDNVGKVAARILGRVAPRRHDYSFPARRKPASKEASGRNRDNGRSSRLKAP